MHRDVRSRECLQPLDRAGLAWLSLLALYDRAAGNTLRDCTVCAIGACLGQCGPTDLLSSSSVDDNPKMESRTKSRSLCCRRSNDIALCTLVTRAASTDDLDLPVTLLPLVSSPAIDMPLRFRFRFRSSQSNL